MALKTVVYTDEKGRRWHRGLPEGVPEARAKSGIPQGPPSLASLGLPLDVEVRLHNQLADRGILTERDARKRMDEIHAALMAALGVDAHRIIAVYRGADIEEERSA